MGADTTGWRDMALAGHGIEVAAPFLDNEVIRACLAVPADQRGAPGRYKPLLGEAFAHAGVLPPFVLSRVTKGGFSARLRRPARTRLRVTRFARPFLAAGRRRPGHRGAGGRDAPVAALGQPTAQGALHLAVAAEVWLRQLETAPAWWEVNSHVATA